jgi:hypothetical protein
MLSDVSQLVEPSKSSVEGLVKVTPQTVISPRNTLSSSTGLVIAYNEPSSHAKNVPTSQSKDSQQPDKPAGLAFDEEAKLVYGVLLSLRHMVQKLSGRLVPVVLR